MRQFGPQLLLDLRIQRSPPSEPPQRLAREGTLAARQFDAPASPPVTKLHRIPRETLGYALNGRVVAGVVRMQAHNEQAAGEEGAEFVVEESLRRLA